jgi:hypothetical protein
MKPASLLRWYPRAWREQYGEELLALIQDTLEDGRPTWRLRLGVIQGGLRERGHQVWRVAEAAFRGWLPMGVVVGLVVASIPGNLKTPLPPARAGQATAAFDALAGILALTGVCVLAGALVAVPAFAAFLRKGGWPKIRRRVAWAAAATVVAGGALTWLALMLGAMTFAQMDHSLSYLMGEIAASLALMVALGLWTSVARATAKQLRFGPRARAAQPLLYVVTTLAALTILSANLIWTAVIEPSLLWLVVGGTNLAMVGVVAPSMVGRAIRRGRRLRAAAGGGRTINPSAQRTHGRHRA